MGPKEYGTEAVGRNTLVVHTPKDVHSSLNCFECSFDMGHSYCTAELGNGHKRGPVIDTKKFRP